MGERTRGMILLQDEDQIYFKKTREYFKEVISDYSNGNYRSAVVMLYSVAICDLLLKLQELVEVYNDGIAKKILDDVNKERQNPSGKSKSSWEKQLVDNIHDKTKLLDLQAYTELNHLYDHRNFSAHPALNENYELLVPSRDTTIAHITNILNNILVKPPVFAKNIVDFLSEDIAAKKDIYMGETKQFKEYIKMKFITKMPDAMKVNVFKAFWKFCFCMPDSEKCMENIKVNRFVLELIMDEYPGILEYIDRDEAYKSISKEKNCCLHFCIFLSKYPFLYDHISDEIKLCINPDEDDHDMRAISWYYSSNKTEHIKNMIINRVFNLKKKHVINYFSKTYRNEGLGSVFADYCIEAYADSDNYDCADFRFVKLISPNLDLFNKEQFTRLIEAIDTNDQIYGRGLAKSSNNEIMEIAKDVLDESFNYDEYRHFNFDRKIIA